MMTEDRAISGMHGVVVLAAGIRLSTRWTGKKEKGKKCTIVMIMAWCDSLRSAGYVKGHRMMATKVAEDNASLINSLSGGEGQPGRGRV